MRSGKRVAFDWLEEILQGAVRYVWLGASFLPWGAGYAIWSLSGDENPVAFGAALVGGTVTALFLRERLPTSFTVIHSLRRVTESALRPGDGGTRLPVPFRQPVGSTEYGTLFLILQNTIPAVSRLTVNQETWIIPGARTSRRRGQPQRLVSGRHDDQSGFAKPNVSTVRAEICIQRR